MLAYLDALIAAIAARDAEEIARLLAQPLARVLTREARQEATAQLHAVLAARTVGVPLRLLQLQHQTAQLLAGRTDREDPVEYRQQPPAPVREDRAQGRTAARAKGRARQMELPLSA
jgi:hypothetical protein